MYPSERWARRLYKMRLGSGLVLSLPILLLAGWYAWSAFAQLDRYRRAMKGSPPFDRELFHLALHDELRRDLRRLSLPERPTKNGLATFELSLTRANLDALNSRGAKEEGQDAYVPALLRTGGEVHEARVRYRGGQHWHWLMPQKSLKVRLDGGGLVDGARVFNLINDATPFGLEDQIALDLARERGVLTPEYRPVWVRLNNNDLGVYRYEAQPDEGLLRRNRRVPGSMFSGDAKEGAAESPLGVFGSRAGWQKVAAHSEQEADDFHELDRLLEAVARSSHRDFAAFAEAHIDLDRYALFDALDVVFGGNEHDYLSNHRLYVDPYSGRFEPVAWTFRGFQDPAGFNAVDHPLLIRLKFTPGYLARRDRLVYELLTGAASVPAIRARVDEELARLAPELAADPYWDAYKLLPWASRFHRFMVRPMSARRWVTSAQSELNTYARRARALVGALESPRVDARWSPADRGPGRLAITVEGEAAWKLREVIAREGECSGALEAVADVDLDGELSLGRDQRASESAGEGRVRIGRFGRLAAGRRLEPRPDANAKRGQLRVVSEPRTYVFFVGAPRCSPSQVTVELESEVTGASLHLEAKPSEGAPLPPNDPAAVAKPFHLAAGERAPHPWSFPARPAPEVVRLGRGTVAFEADQEFGEHQSVVIAPGTTLALSPWVTVIFRGPLRAIGTAEEPISIRAAARLPFGGIVLRGPGTQGSTLEWVHIEGGSHGRERFGELPGLLEIHDTESVTLSNVFLRSGGQSEDVLHIAQVKGLRMQDLTVADSPNDGIDLELVSGEIRNVQVLGAADDCLDLMGVNLRLYDTVLLGCRNNGVSAGEEAQLDAHRVLVAGSRTGVLAKNGSGVRLTESVVFRTHTALRTKGRDKYYPTASAIRAENFHSVECSEVHDRASGTAIEVRELHASLVPGSLAERWLQQVLRLEQRDALQARVDHTGGGGPQ